MTLSRLPKEFRIWLDLLVEPALDRSPREAGTPDAREKLLNRRVIPRFTKHVELAPANADDRCELLAREHDRQFLADAKYQRLTHGFTE